MFLSKNAKRFMSTAAVLAMTVASLVVAPKAEAAGEATVKVLGATLRLGETQDGTQSMRAGIKVTNADKAKACGIKLNVGQTTVDVSTEAPKYQKIYECDEANSTITYTAVITNIPKDSFTTNINVQGVATPVAQDANEISSGEPVSKNVQGVVDELRKIDSTISLNKDGKLIRTVGNGEEDVTASDPIFIRVFETSKKVVFSSETFMDEGDTNYWPGRTASYGADGSVSYTAKTENSGGGIAWYVNKDKSPIKLSEFKSLTIKAKAEGQSEALKGVTPVVLCLYNKADYWDGTAELGDIPIYGNINATTTTLTYDLTKITNQDQDIYAVNLKYNAYVPNGENFNGSNVKMTIESIEFSK